MAVERVLPQDEEEGLPPPVVVGRHSVEDDGHQRADALDSDGLLVELEDGSSLVSEEGVLEGGARRVGDARCHVVVVIPSTPVAGRVGGGLEGLLGGAVFLRSPLGGETGAAGGLVTLLAGGDGLALGLLGADQGGVAEEVGLADAVLLGEAGVLRALGRSGGVVLGRRRFGSRGCRREGGGSWGKRARHGAAQGGACTRGETLARRRARGAEVRRE